MPSRLFEATFGLMEVENDNTQCFAAAKGKFMRSFLAFFTNQISDAIEKRGCHPPLVEFRAPGVECRHCRYVFRVQWNVNRWTMTRFTEVEGIRIQHNDTFPWTENKGKFYSYFYMNDLVMLYVFGVRWDSHST